LRQRAAEEGRRAMQADEFHDALIDAAKRGDIGAIRSILATPGGEESLNTALRLALREGQIAAASYLIDRGARLNGYPVSLFANPDAESAIELLIEKGVLDINAQRDFELRQAARDGRPEDARLLLDQGANPRAQNGAALREAARRGHLELVRLLLDRGAQARASQSDSLVWAARNGHLEVARLLLERGADPRAQDWAALRQAIRRGAPEVVRELLERVEPDELKDADLRTRAADLLLADENDSATLGEGPRRKLFPWLLTIRRG
jgi:ankyrin repeat protein